MKQLTESAVYGFSYENRCSWKRCSAPRHRLLSRLSDYFFFSSDLSARSLVTTLIKSTFSFSIQQMQSKFKVAWVIVRKYHSPLKQPQRSNVFKTKKGMAVGLINYILLSNLEIPARWKGRLSPRRLTGNNC